MIDTNVIAALKAKINGMDAVEKAMIAAVPILLFLAAASSMQGSVGGGAAGIGSRGRSGLSGLGMLGRGLGR